MKPKTLPAGRYIITVDYKGRVIDVVDFAAHIVRARFSRGRPLDTVWKGKMYVRPASIPL